MIAAGETPSPEMVAASGEEGALSRTSVLMISVAMVLSVSATALFAGRAHTINLFPPANRPTTWLTGHAIWLPPSEKSLRLPIMPGGSPSRTMLTGD